MRSLSRSLSALVATLAVSTSAAALDLPFKKSKLENGLTVIVHEDHTLPIVAVNLVYRVGSRDEEVKRTGFAHLFEHLMFMGTRRAPPKMFDAWMEAAGGANNAWTSEDLTDYHELGPPSSLPLLLWLEADRLETLGREIDAAKLDLQRDVVRNERRQSIENVPYGRVELRMPELLWPDGHPYHHPVIGSHEDLEAASVDDVRRFFEKNYVPANAALVVAGDAKEAEIGELVKRLFGGIPGGVRPPRAEAKAPARLGKVVRETIEDHVELSKIVMTFHAPPKLAPGDADLDLFAAILATGKSSRLYKALVYDKPLAQSVGASESSSDLASAFTIEAVARQGVSLDDLEKAIDAVLTEAIAKPPADDELRRAKSRYEHAFVSGLQSIEARARLLALYEVETGDPGFVDKDLARYRAATTASVNEWAKKVVTLGERVIVRVVPKPENAKGGTP